MLKKLSKLSKYELTLYAQHNMKMNEERMEMKMESGLGSSGYYVMLDMINFRPIYP